MEAPIATPPTTAMKSSSNPQDQAQHGPTKLTNTFVKGKDKDKASLPTMLSFSSIPVVVVGRVANKSVENQSVYQFTSLYQSSVQISISVT
jgi:hypothetical protein